MSLTHGQIRFVPIVHRRLTFAEEVRRAVVEHQPDVIAVELPETLAEWIIRGVLRLPQISAVCYEEADRPGELAYLPIDPCDGLVEAVRLGCAREIELAFIDLDLPGLREEPAFIPDDLIIDKTGLAEYVETLSPFFSSREDDWQALARECRMAGRLLELTAGGRKVVCVLGMAHYLRVREMLDQERIVDPHALAPTALRRREQVTLAHVRRSSLVQFLAEIPNVAWQWERARDLQEEKAAWGRHELPRFDKLAAIQRIYRRAGRNYVKTYRETINLTQWKSLLQYTRNLALVTGRLRPDLYEIALAAQGVVDGDYAYEVLEIARHYGQRDDSSDLPRLRFIAGVGAGRAELEGREERFTLAPRWPDQKGDVVRLNLRRRPPRRLREEWKERWKNIGAIRTCSWPPEDEIQERFMNYVRKRALQVITEDRKQVVEFSNSMLDGLDIRETMRNFHTGKLFVHQTPQPRGRVGAVVLILRDEPLEAAHTWRATLYAENQNESDISFYATPLGEQVVGPRISRTEFKGILSVWPAWGIPDLWRFQMGDMIHSAAEALLAGGVLFSPYKYIAVVAPKPPRAQLREFAEHYGKHFIYMPLHTFSRNLIRKIRRFHILDGHEVREWARDYIFED